jgi:hypothetical protein
MTDRNNYFKSIVGSGKAKIVHTFLFRDGSYESIFEAFTAAQSMGGTVSLYAPPPVAGPWDRFPLIGHRDRAEILKDLSRTVDDDNRFWLNEELTALHERFSAVGRTIPPQAVAA